MIHYLKAERKYFILTWFDKKLFEIRYDDRGYQVGDGLVLEETYGDSSVKTVRHISAVIENIHKNLPGLKKGYVILIIKIKKKESF